MPGTHLAAANEWVDVVIPSGLGEARNALVVSSSTAVIAVGGEYGTLSEIALALRAGIPVIGVDTWRLIRPDGVVDTKLVRIRDPRQAAAEAVRLASRERAE